MIITKRLKYFPYKIISWSALAALCLGLSTNTEVDAANPSRSTQSFLPAPNLKSDIVKNENLVKPNLASLLKVISDQDTTLYRTIFNAQERGDWVRAQEGLSHLSDKRLIGHVLADRFRRGVSTPVELSVWLTSYADHPEAEQVYDLFKNQPSSSLLLTTEPSAPDEWSGINSYGSSFGFKSTAITTKWSTTSKRFMAKIERAVRHGDPYKAETLLETEKHRRTLDPQELAEVESRIAASFYYEGRIDHARKLAADAAENGQRLAMWIAGLCSWKEGEFAIAASYFTELAKVDDLSGWDRSAAAYWAYRSLKEAGEDGEANTMLHLAAAQPRSFYGILASHFINHHVKWSWQLPSISHTDIETLSRLPAGGRALALLQVGRNDLAEAELRRIDPRSQKNLRQIMLAIAYAFHMPGLTIQLGSIVTNANGQPYDAALYPLPPWAPENGFNVDPALIYALMRQESQFDPTAVSGRGACGLMQVMPTTAAMVTTDTMDEKYRELIEASNNHNCTDTLLDPNVNATVGQNYVRFLANQPTIGNNLLFLLAAYNGGPGKISRWVDDLTRRDPLLFIESLPVRETRDYVQQVMIQYWSYRARLAETDNSLSELASGNFPSVTLIEHPAKVYETFNHFHGFELADNIAISP